MYVDSSGIEVFSISCIVDPNVVSLTMISAAKYHSYGNDFLVFLVEEVGRTNFSVLTKSICHPHQGLGADGCVFLNNFSHGQFSLRIFNRDGSEASMSGNGARCASAFLHHRGLVEGPQVNLQTQSGSKVFTLLQSCSTSWKYSSTMGLPAFVPALIPFRASTNLENVQDYPLEIQGREIQISALSVGNPQCVIFMDQLPSDYEFKDLGRALENHSSFPERTNVSFVVVRDAHRLDIRIWERGVGPTHSSGTGSCGAAVAAIRKNCAKSPIEVHTETGSQQVEWTEGGEIQLTGETDFIAEVRFHGS